MPEDSINAERFNLKSDQMPGGMNLKVPSTRTIASKCFHSLLKALRQGSISLALNAVKAAMSNMIHFTFQGDRDRVTCSCCAWHGTAFIAHYNWNSVSYQSICPQCSAQSRHRGLVYLYENSIEGNGRLLYFAPEKILLDGVLKNKAIQVETTDRFMKDVDHPKQDIQKLDFDSGSYDHVLCNHVIEHVPDDEAAIAECSRILNNKGIAIFTIPGDFDKRETRVFSKPDDNGHYRHYGMDVVDKFEKHFSLVKTLRMADAAPAENRIKKDEVAFVCHK